MTRKIFAELNRRIDVRREYTRRFVYRARWSWISVSHSTFSEALTRAVRTDLLNSSVWSRSPESASKRKLDLTMSFSHRTFIAIAIFAATRCQILSDELGREPLPRKETSKLSRARHRPEIGHRRGFRSQ